MKVRTIELFFPVYILFFLLFNSSFYGYSQIVTTRIKLNQVGFYPHGPKVAVVTGDVVSKNFYITTTNLRDTIYTGALSEEKLSAYSSTKTKIADFSAVSIRGSFVLLIGEVGHSYVFEIGDHVYGEVARETLKGFYYQRASMPLEEKYAGKWHRSTGHPDDIVYIHPSAADGRRSEGTIISTPGGWYDAGDYNKYIVNSGITMGTIFSAYEDFAEYFKILYTNIPESNDGVPDILNEAIYNLRWMLSMQDPNDGGVYQKTTNAAFDGMVMPGITKSPRYVVQKGTAATLDFASVTAQASRILNKFTKQLPALADSCLIASKKAWEWALLNPSLEYNQVTMNQTYKPVILTGGYGDKNFKDEWFWAASELYISTRNKKYYQVVENLMKENISLPSWGNVAMLGYYSFLRYSKELPVIAKDLSLMKQKVLTIANEYIEKVSANAFQTIMGQTVKDFNWGGNSNAANQGILLISAYFITREKKYVDYALKNLDYLLGRNATGYCFVTGFGSRSPMFPHHRPSTADGITEPVPGLLVGGPNPGMQDKCVYEFKEPELAYIDNDCSYASNEIAINWNAPVVYLTNAIEALKQKTGYTGKK